MAQGRFDTLIDAEALAASIGAPDLVVVDCRFDLMDIAAGRREYLQGHVPGALYADLDHDLSGPPLTDRGRHPLPSEARLRDTFSGFGIDSRSQVVAYDRRDGAVAARLWWLLRYMGHDAVAVLDGGLDAWEAAGGATEVGPVSHQPREFGGAARARWLVRADEVAAQALLVDARAAARYRGDHEPLDRVAGHVPGAINRCFLANLAEDGRFLAPQRLRQEWLAVIGSTGAQEVTHYCGSGVTACHNLLATAHAGLPPGRLYAGSWSDWCSDPEREVETGA